MTAGHPEHVSRLPQPGLLIPAHGPPDRRRGWPAWMRDPGACPVLADVAETGPSRWLRSLILSYLTRYLSTS